MTLSNISATDAIIRPSRGSAQGWIDWVNRHRDTVKRPDDVIAYINAVYELCAPDDMPDAFIVITDAFLETGNFSNRWWSERLNAGSLGVTGDAAQNEASPTFKTPLQAARAHVSHLLLYATGQIDRGSLVPADDPRYLAYRDAYGTSAYPTIAGLTGRYAADPFYAAKIAQRQQEIYPVFTTPVEQPPAGGSTVSIVFGNVPYPDVIKSHFPTSNPWIGSGAPAILEAVVWHRMLGTWAGTNAWGQAGNFATAYGVSVKATDGTGGKIYEWIAPNSGLYGESSGPVNAPYGDGLALVNKVGVSSVNRTTKAIEISGNYDTPLDADAKHAVAALTAYFADQKHIPWDQFPIIPGENRSFVVWHQEITIGSGKVCPGQVVMDATPEMIQMTADIMKQYQETGVPVPEPKPEPAPTPKPGKYATPITYPWLSSEDANVHNVGSTRVLPLTLTYTAQKATPRYQKGSKQAEKIGPNIAKGTQFEANRVFRSGDGITFVMTRYGSRVLASALMPRVAVTTSGRISIRHSATDDDPTVISDNVTESA